MSFGESDFGARGGRPGVYTNLLTHAAWVRGIIGLESGTISCSTTDGRQCRFPFNFRGTTYSSCTKEHDPDDLCT